MPSLRDRREDIPLLIDHFLRVFNRELGKNVRSITAEASRLLASYDWPGNVRELQSAIRFAMLHATGEVLTPDWLPEACRPAGMQATASVSTSAVALLDVANYTRQLLKGNQGDIYRLVSAAVDRVVVDEVLRHVRGNQLQAAELLGISRTTLRAKMRTLDLAVEKGMQSAGELSVKKTDERPAL